MGCARIGPYSGYSVYLSPAACAGLPSAPRALAASALLLAAVERAPPGDGDARDAPRRRVVEVIRDEIRDQPQAADALLLPAEARLQRLALALSDDPADTRTLAQWADWIGMAPRTLARHFLAETGLTLSAWQRARLMRALEMLEAGAAVTTVALDLGYDNVSAFIAMFKREHGVTPGRYAPGGA